MKHLSRRAVLSYSLGGAVALESLGALACRSNVFSPNDRLGVAVIGMNGMGHVHVKTLAGRTDVRLVSLCDVDQAVLQRAADHVF